MASGSLWAAANSLWTANWNGTSSVGAGMIGADGGCSVLTAAGTVDWFMGDTPIATAAGQTRHTATWVRNCVIRQTGTGAPLDLSDAGTTLTSYYQGGSTPTDLFPMGQKDGAPHWFWPNNGLMVDGVLVLVAYRMESEFRAAGHSLFVIDNPTAVPTSWNMARFDTLVQSDPRFILAGPVIDDGDSWVYLSAFQQGGQMYMARVARTELTKGRVTTPQWWRVTSQWAYDKPDLVGHLYGRFKRKAVDSTSLSPHLTIHKRGASDYVEVCHKGSPVNLAYAKSTALTGPYTPASFFQPAESTQTDASGVTYSVYSGKAHPEQTWSGKGANDCLVSYAVNTSGFNQFDDYNVYWPRMVKATGLT